MRSRQSTTTGGWKQRGMIPLFHAACLFALGIAATRWLWLSPPVALMALAALAAVVVLAALFAARLAWVAVSLLWIVLGAWCAWMEPQPARSTSLDAITDGLMRSVEGTIAEASPLRREIERNVNEHEADAGSEASQTTQPSQRIDLDLDRAEWVDDASDHEIPVAGRVRFTVRWPADAQPALFHCGERVRAVVRLLHPQIYRDPGAWNREEFLLGQGVSATATVKIEQIEMRAPPSQIAWSCRISNWQHGAAMRLQTLPTLTQKLPATLRISADDAAMLAAMVAGDRSYLTRSLRVGFERTGSFHMLVVAGFHLAVITAFLFWITEKLRLPRLPATLLVMAATFAYALFTGFALPVARACWMVTLYLIGRLVARDHHPLNAVGFAALLLLAYRPRTLFDASLQMTLLAVVAIAGIAVPLLQCSLHPYAMALRQLRLVALDHKVAPRHAQFRVAMRMRAQALEQATARWIGWTLFPQMMRAIFHVAEAVVVCLFVELAMTLPMAIYFHRVTLTALPVNLLVLPLLFLLLPAALVTLCLLAIWPAAASVPAAITALTLHFGLWLVHGFGALEWGDVRLPMPTLLQQAGFYIFCAVALVCMHFVTEKKRRWLGALACAAVFAAAAVVVLPRAVEHPRNALLVEALDVGQGDALLLITPDGKTLLIDSGGFGGGPRIAPQEFDIGEEVVAPALWARGIRHLDAVALSHAHSDHMGGMVAVLRDFHPDALWVGNNPSSPDYDALLQEAARLHVAVRSFRAGDNFAFGRAQVRVLAPFADYRPGDEPANNDSLVLRVAYGATSALFEGDAEGSIESAIAAEPAVDSTLLKVGHHGSRTSTHDDFLAKVHPQWAVISCGLHNRYRHPAPETLARLTAAHILTARTDLLGATCFALNGSTVHEDAGCTQ